MAAKSEEPLRELHHLNILYSGRRALLNSQTHTTSGPFEKVVQEQDCMKKSLASQIADLEAQLKAFDQLLSFAGHKAR